ncbi:nitrilase [Ktedonosporobacter rubrisoli]|uniref:Nitrilase n=1 Tax=Ktedonosporobacter rubrisoli TaxID=2509675 RepID=A0A4P6JSF9_KTERU|nr:nitrilase-related carbon-nitrogen hydrolase [Ktedonosporobacter rubrisoli]QBD78275.1 nitrilase [Ktedonosporobacter rubrisoli]
MRYTESLADSPALHHRAGKGLFFNYRSFLWLALGTLLACFASNGIWDLSIAAWLYPTFFLRFTRTHKPLIALAGVWLANVVSIIFVLYESRFPGGPTVILFGAFLIFATIFTLPYLLDRLLTERIGSRSVLLMTLVFPLGRVACEYLLSFVPFGGVFSLGYTQHSNLPLLQLLSVTGVYGISFLITWFASVVAWIWEQRFFWDRIRPLTLLYTGVLVLILLGGGIRLAFFTPSAQTVRIAGVTVSKATSRHASKYIHGEHIDLAQARTAFTIISNELFALSQREARAGAKIVIWAEKDVLTLEDDKAHLIERAQSLAQQEHIYLEMGLAVVHKQATSLELLQNQAILINPEGKVVWTYNKAHPVPGLENIPPGDGTVPVSTTPYGRLANVLCFDADFPSLLQQAGHKGIDIMLVPALDWAGIDPWHTQHATFRAIENGYSLVRQTSQGLSETVDYQGHILAATDYYTTDQQTMVAAVPIQGTWTLYAQIGDLFSWLCCAGLFLLTRLAIFMRSQPQTLAK